MITPFNVADVAVALETRLDTDPELLALGLSVAVGESLNNDPSICPWAGIYATKERYTPRALTGGPGYRRQFISFAIVTQQTSTESGKDCQGKLGTLNRAVLRVLLGDETVQGFFDVIEELQVEWAAYSEDQASRFMQSSIIYVTGVTNVSGG